MTSVIYTNINKDPSDPTFLILHLSVLNFSFTILSFKLTKHMASYNTIDISP